MKKAVLRITSATQFFLLTALISIGAMAQENHPPVLLSTVTQPLQPILTPVTNTITGLTSLLTRSREMKLLVIAADGTEPSFSAIRAILGQMGVPYDPVILTQTGGQLPPLEGFLKGNYQGIILATGNLVTCAGGPCVIALPNAGWKKLDEYAVQYGVRTLAYYTFPDPRYGLTWTGTAAQGGLATFSPAASQAFPNLNSSTPLRIEHAYLYGATPVAGAGETTTSILSAGGQTIGAIHKKADKREYLALTFDNNPQLLHTLTLSYGLVHWVTKGIFIGERKHYFSPQIDDIFLSSDLFLSSNADCRPQGFQLDPTIDPTASCPTIRMTGDDLNKVKQWQDAVSAEGAGTIKVAMAFNGLGTKPEVAPAPDSLTSAAIQHRASFHWVTHTYDHENLDCFEPVPNSGACSPATYSQSLAELTLNDTVARQLNLVQDKYSIVTPNLSGLKNPNFMLAAKNFGIRYTVMDSSQLPSDFAHNTAIRNQHQSSILMIPRRPTNIFYNVHQPGPGAGSAVEEYNYFYGPNGISRVGGPGGPPFFAQDQTYAEILGRESDLIVKNMLRGEVYPLMFHQTNLVFYDGTHSLFTDLAGAALQKFRAITSQPVNSLSQSAMAQVAMDRMEFDASRVSATLNPGISITIKVSKSARIPITGLCRSACDSNGGQPVSYFNTNWLLPTIVLLP